MAGWRSEPLFRLLSILLVLIPAVVVMLAPAGWWIDHLLIGDAAAYPIIARNVMSGAGLTYDGITPTNGFHPLWLVLQLPLMVGAASAVDRLLLVKALVVLVTLGGALVWRQVVARFTGSATAGLIMMAWVGASGWSLYVLYAGIETPLVVLLMGMSLLVARSAIEQPTPRRAAGLGLVMGLCFLARLDSIFFLLPLALATLPTLFRGGRLVAPVAAAGGLIVSLPYLVFNLARFGGITPVSGVVKTSDTLDVPQSLALLTDATDRIGRLMPAALQPVFPIFMVLLMLGALGIAMVVFTHLPSATPFNLLILLPVAAVLHFAYYALFIRELLVPWHMYLQVISGYLLMAVLPMTLRGLSLRRAVPLSRVLTWLLAATLVLSTGAYATIKQKRRSDRECSYVGARWLGDLPSGTRSAMYDGWYVQLLAGPDYHVLDLSGLVTDRATALLAKRGDYPTLLRRHDIEYVLGFEEFATTIDSLAVLRGQEVHWSQGKRLFVLARREGVD